MSDERTAIVIGAGIGGLTAALALRQIGMTVRVYERAPDLRSAGAGLSLAPNAIQALRVLDLDTEVRRLGTEVEFAEIRSWRGACLQRLPVGELGRRYGGPMLCVARPELLGLLANTLGQEHIRFDYECTGFTQDDSGVTARFAGGAVERADLLIGADGIHSVIRRHLLDDGRPRYAGYTAWRGMAEVGPELAPPGLAFEAWGRGARFGLWRIDPARVYWWATSNAPEGALGEPGDHLQRLRELFHDRSAPIPAVVEATPPAAILQNDIYDREPASRWGEGRVTLLGDAAHPMTPDLGQGACQAIEDAVILAGSLARSADLPAALRAYEAARRARTARVVRLARHLGRIAQWENPLACAIRDRAVRMTPRRVAEQQFALLARFELPALLTWTSTGSAALEQPAPDQRQEHRRL